MADDEADDDAGMRALTGWRHELFGETAPTLEPGQPALAVERGRVARHRAD